MAESLTKDLQDLMECGICLETMTSPRMLSCQHSFCCLCLETLDYNSASLEIVCPTCRAVTVLPAGGVEDLPLDFKLNTLSELISKTEDPPGVKKEEPVWEVVEESKEKVVSEEKRHPEKPACALCPKGKGGKQSKSKVEWFCKDCQDHMCKPCGNKHKKTPIFSGHELIHTPESQWGTEKCSEHPQKSKEYYCVECKVLICSLCVTNQHRKHQVHDIVERAKDCLREVNMKKSRLDAVYSESAFLNADEQEMQQFQETVNKGIIEVAGKVEKCADLTMQRVEKEKSRLLAALERDKMAFNKAFKRVQADSLKAKVKNIKEKCDAYSKTKNPVELLVDCESLSGTLEKSITSILESDKEASAFMSLSVPSGFNEAQQKMLIGFVTRSEEVRYSQLFPNAQGSPGSPPPEKTCPTPNDPEVNPLDSLFRSPSLSSLSSTGQSNPHRGRSRGRPPHRGNRGHSQDRSAQPHQQGQGEGQNQGQGQNQGRGQGRGPRRGRGEGQGRGQNRGHRGGQVHPLLPDPAFVKDFHGLGI